MEMKEYENVAKIFKAFGDPNRLMIMSLLQSGEKCACNLLDNLQIRQSTLSHHMKILCDSGVVTSRKEGKWTHYAIDPEGRELAKELLEDITQVSIEEQSCSCSNK